MPAKVEGERDKAGLGGLPGKDGMVFLATGKPVADDQRRGRAVYGGAVDTRRQGQPIAL